MDEEERPAKRQKTDHKVAMNDVTTGIDANCLAWFPLDGHQNITYTEDVPPETKGLGTEDDSDCPICYETLLRPEEGHTIHGLIKHESCQRVFHDSCYTSWIDEADTPYKDATCPMCRGVVIKATRQRREPEIFTEEQLWSHFGVRYVLREQGLVVPVLHVGQYALELPTYRVAGFADASPEELEHANNELPPQDAGEAVSVSRTTGMRSGGAYLQDIDEEDMSAIGALFDDDVSEEPVGIDI